MVKKPAPSRPRQRKTDTTAECVASRSIVTKPHDRRQLELLVFKDPFPAWIEPCKPKLVSQPPEGEQWSHEIKWDGYRVSAYLKDGEVRIRTSSALDWMNRFPAIAASIAQLPVQSAVIDGEAVVVDEMGRSGFGDIQAALARRSGGNDVLLYAFDLLYFDGLDIRHWPLRNRRAVLEGLLAGERGAVLLSEEFEVTGEAAFKVACEHGLECVSAWNIGSDAISMMCGPFMLSRSVLPREGRLAGIKSVRRPESSRNRWPDCVGSHM